MSKLSSSPHKLSSFPGMFYFFITLSPHSFTLTLSKSHVNVGIDLEKLGPGIESLLKNEKKSKKLFLILNNISEIRRNRHQKKTTAFSCILTWSPDLLSFVQFCLKKGGKILFQDLLSTWWSMQQTQGQSWWRSYWRWDNIPYLLLLHYPHAPQSSIPPRFISRQVLLLPH